MKKVFILDTNVLLSDPRAIFRFDDNDVIVPIAVIEEIDHFKKDHTDIGRNAREVSRVMDRFRDKGTLSAGVQIHEDRDDSGTLSVDLGHGADNMPPALTNSVDNRILAIAISARERLGESHGVVVITRDTNLRIKADAFGIEAEDFEADHVPFDESFTGIKRIVVDAEVINEFYAEREHSFTDQDLRPNEFVILRDSQDDSQMVHGVYDASSGCVRMLEPRTEGVWGIFPRNLEQTFALEALLDDRIQLVTISGEAGTGKTLMAIAAGLCKSTDEDVYNKLLVSRPIFPLGRDIGYLPGDLDEKLNPWMQPIFDNLELLLGGHASGRSKRMSKSYQELISQEMLAIEPLTYIRGRSIPNQFFIVDEAQNLTPHEAKTILTRAGEGTKIVMAGDPYQIDQPYLDSTTNGLTYVIERFKNEAITAHITLRKGERSELATVAARLL